MNCNSNEVSSFCIMEYVFCTCARIIIFFIKLFRDMYSEVIIFHSRGQLGSDVVICFADVRLRQVQLRMQHTSLEFPSGCISVASYCGIRTPLIFPLA